MFRVFFVSRMHDALPQHMREVYNSYMIHIQRDKKRILVITSIVVSFCVIALLLWTHYSSSSDFLLYPVKTMKRTEIWHSIWNKNGSHIEKFSIPFGQGSRKIEVYLPNGYDPDSRTAYPTLYLLHGKGGNETDWLNQGDAQETLDTAIENKIIEPLIVVFPDGNGSPVHNTQYINSASGSELNEDLIYKDLVRLISQKYRVKDDPRFRAIGGNSAGGFGSINIGLKHQNIFGQIMAFSGYGRLLTYSSPALIQNSQEIIDNNSPLTYISKIKNKDTKVWMTIGSSDYPAFVEDNNNLKKAFDTAAINNQLTITSGGHDWNFWKSQLDDGLNWLGTQWRDQN